MTKNKNKFDLIKYGVTSLVFSILSGAFYFIANTAKADTLKFYENPITLSVFFWLALILIFFSAVCFMLAATTKE